MILDNHFSHKGKAVRRTIRVASDRPWFLPSYSHDLNPIEQALSTLKDDECVWSNRGLKS